jgi:hypothetical protein
MIHNIHSKPATRTELYVTGNPNVTARARLKLERRGEEGAGRTGTVLGESERASGSPNRGRDEPSDGSSGLSVRDGQREAAAAGGGGEVAGGYWLVACHSEFRPMAQTESHSPIVTL